MRVYISTTLFDSEITTILFFFFWNLKMKSRLNDLPQLPSLWHYCGDGLAIGDAPAAQDAGVQLHLVATAASGSREEIDY